MSRSRLPGRRIQAPEVRRRARLALASSLLTAVFACTDGGTTRETPAPARAGPAPLVPRLQLPACLEQVTAAEIDRLFAEKIGPTEPGAAVAVLHNGALLHQGGYGLARLAGGEPVTPRTAFRLASVSKQLVAMATLILAEEGRLSLDDPVMRFLPGLGRFGSGLTIRHLLTHSSGLPDYYDALTEASPGHKPTNDDVLDFLTAWGTPRFVPGDRYEYSNAGYDLLASILARAAGTPFSEVMHTRIFSPLDMTGTFVFDQSEPEIPSRAIAYAPAGGNWRLADNHLLNHIVGSGGIYSTVEDLARWDRALAAGELVSARLLEQAFSPYFADPEEPAYGFGWRVGADARLGRVLYHSGSWIGFRSFIARYPEAGLTVIVLANRADFDAPGHGMRLARLYAPGFLIRGATVIDGTGSARRRADVRIRDDRIAAVAPTLEAGGCEPVLEANGLVLTPGFIDSHSHAERHILEQPAAVAAVSQGITTVVVGQDGESPFPLAEFVVALGEEGTAIDIAALAGHGTLRKEVLGAQFRRPASPEETAAMAKLLDQELTAGARGLSTGLEYDPGIYSTTAELIALARVAAAHGGIYVSHIRSEDRRFWEAMQEIVTIGRQAALPVHVSHLKLAMRSSHGETARLRRIFESARDAGVAITADLYPYTFWQSSLTVLFPERAFRDRAEAEIAVTEVSVPEEMLIPRFLPDPTLAGKTLAQIASTRGTDPAETLMDLIAEAQEFERATGEEDVERVIAVSMAEADVEAMMRWPWVGFCTDGELIGPHPRGRGSYPRIFGRYVRNRDVLSLEQAVRKMTSLPARVYGLDALGAIAPGRRANLVLFDPERILDRATTNAPQALSEGVHRVWVGGELVWDGARPAGARPGRFLRPGGAAVPNAGAASVRPRGHLFIVGGGTRPDELMRRFVELAGGPGEAEVVVLPLASGSPHDTGADMAAHLEALGARSRVLIPTREQAESSDAGALLAGATAVWFTGGDQARVTPVLRGTPLNTAIRALYARGGVLGGTSAGAAVMSDPMLTGNQVRGTLGYYGDEFRRIARDYIDLQPGLGYLPGAILDQHFTTRERHNRLLSAVLSRPDLLGVGIDESTVLLVRPEGTWEVLGESVVSVYDARAATIPLDSGGPLGASGVRLHVLPPGSLFDPRRGVLRPQSESLPTGGHARGDRGTRFLSIHPCSARHGKQRR